MSRKQRRRKHRKDQDKGTAAPGMVLVMEGEDRPIRNDEIINIEEKAKQFPDGVPKFRTRPADPMRAFTKPEMMKDSPFVTTQETAIGLNRGHQQAFKGMDAPRHAHHLSGLKTSAVQILDVHDTPSSPKPLGSLDTQAMRDAIKHFAPHQQERALDAIKHFDVPTAGAVVDPMFDETQASIADRRHTLSEQREILRKRDIVLTELKAVAANLKMQKVTESCFHKAVDAWRSGTTILPANEFAAELHADVRGALGSSKEIGIFLVQHDWAGAFQNAQDFDGGEVRLPYDETVFEVRLGGHRICLSIAGAANTTLVAIVNFESSVGWALGACYRIDDGTWTFNSEGADLCAGIMQLMVKQVRAICIALEAEVATTEVIRAPYRLNQKRERKGQLPIYDHHIVSLARRVRHQSREALPGDLEVEHRKKRLHFVRGHWRHYASSKTFVKWHLRGDPDLGFIDKEYRL